MFAVWATSLNLLDPVVKADMKGKLMEIWVEALSYCKYCMSTASATSKHCGQCDKCVENFDHHC